MGYTTTFEGQFTLSREQPEKIRAFLSAIEERPAEIGVFADWLEDEGDGRATAVRACTTYPRVRRIFHGLSEEHAAYLRQFARTRRMRRDPNCATLADPVRQAVGLPVGPEGAYFVGGLGYAGQDRDDSVLDGNSPPKGQPGLWCQWVPSKDGDAIVWSGGEKFYDYVEWLRYLITHFLGPWGYVLNGSVTWQGEDEEDRGILKVENNTVSARRTSKW